jgi:hypothetical protein
MKILHLTVKKKWFDMEVSGIKKDEYRAIKTYWVTRLINIRSEMEFDVFDEFCTDLNNSFKNHHDSVDELLIYYDCEFKKFDAVKITNGYSKKSPSALFECNGIEIGTAVPEWSDNWPGNVFKIKLGERIELRIPL